MSVRQQLLLRAPCERWHWVQAATSSLGGGFGRLESCWKGHSCRFLESLTAIAWRISNEYYTKITKMNESKKETNHRKFTKTVLKKVTKKHQSVEFRTVKNRSDQLDIILKTYRKETNVAINEYRIWRYDILHTHQCLFQQKYECNRWY